MESPEGKHIIVDLSGINKSYINDADYLTDVLKECVKISGATLLQLAQHKFSPEGISMTLILQESHLAVHTWPGLGYMSLDMYTCGAKCDPSSILPYIKQKLQPSNMHITILGRGIIADGSGSYIHSFIDLKNCLG